MIVRERHGEFILVKQYDHSQIAGAIASHWREKPAPLESTLLAVRDHDLAWQRLDQSVRFNPATGKPYSFMDLPLADRLPAYTWGIDRVEEVDAYAACLCSRHYVSLVKRYEGARAFVESEAARDSRLTAQMDEEAKGNLDRNLELLKTCDRISLFLCLNEPGENAFPRYREGIPNGEELLRPVWEDRSALRFEPSPLETRFEVRIPYTRVSEAGELLGSGEIAVRILP